MNKEYFEYKNRWHWDMNTDLFEYKLFLNIRKQKIAPTFTG